MQSLNLYSIFFVWYNSKAIHFLVPHLSIHLQHKLVSKSMLKSPSDHKSELKVEHNDITFTNITNNNADKNKHRIWFNIHCESHLCMPKQRQVKNNLQNMQIHLQWVQLILQIHRDGSSHCLQWVTNSHPPQKKSKPTFIFSNSGTSLLLVSLHVYYATLHVSLLVLLTNNSNIGSRMIFARSHGLLSFTMHTKSSFVHFWLDLNLYVDECPCKVIKFIAPN